MEGNGIIPNGWPLGLGNTNSRIRVVGVAAPLQPSSVACRHRRSLSFSSFTSSNLDTESTMSFFRDGSVTLGRLIGIEASMHSHSNCGSGIERNNNGIGGDERCVGPNKHSNAQGLCAPLLHHVIGKISSKRHQ